MHSNIAGVWDSFCTFAGETTKYIKMRKLLMMVLVGACACGTGFAQKNFKASVNLKQGWRFPVEMGYTFGSNSGGRLEMTPSAGYQVNPYVFLGAGAGIDYYTDADEFFVPIYADIRGYIPIHSKIHPFIDIKPGYGCDLNGDCASGFYVNVTSGVEIGNFYAGIGYGSQTMNYSLDTYYVSSNYTVHSDGFTMKIGYVF
jgi:hypothetical protein